MRNFTASPLAYAALIATLLAAVPSPVAAQDVVVKNEPSAAVPVIPAPGATPFQFYSSINGGQIYTVLGPMEAGKQGAITGFTISNGGTQVASIILTASTVEAPRGSAPECKDSGATVTALHLGGRETIHMGYTQPLLAPQLVPDEQWCLVILSSRGASVTIIGYIK